jgi:hypothetical protein
VTIRQLSGDSSVAEVLFASGQARCRLEDGATGAEYSLSVATPALYSQASSEAGSVHLRLIELKDVLPVESKSQLYMAPAEFGAQMQAAREGFLLAVGLKSSEWPLFLQIRGYRILVACPVQSESSIRIEPLESGERALPLRR